MEASVLRAFSLAGVAWIASAACAGLAAWHARRLLARRSPGVDALVAELREGAAAPGGVEFARSELLSRQGEAERSLTLATMLPRSLARIALATGTAVALLALTSAGEGRTMSSIVGALVAFVGGLFGSTASALFGRQARERAHTARAEWRRHVLEAERRLKSDEVDPQRVDRGEKVGLRS